MKFKYILANKLNHEQDGLEMCFADIREVHPGCFVILLKWESNAVMRSILRTRCGFQRLACDN